jgi:hypothetical protein
MDPDTTLRCGAITGRGKLGSIYEGDQVTFECLQRVPFKSKFWVFIYRGFASAREIDLNITTEERLIKIPINECPDLCRDLAYYDRNEEAALIDQAPELLVFRRNIPGPANDFTTAMTAPVSCSRRRVPMRKIQLALVDRLGKGLTKFREASVLAEIHLIQLLRKLVKAVEPSLVADEVRLG